MDYLYYTALAAESRSYASASAFLAEYGFPAYCEFSAEGLTKAIEIIFAVGHSDFAKLVELTNIKPASFCRKYSIPPRSLYHWVSGNRQPPEYLIQLLGYALLSECEKISEKT